jgi:hypothetical protein
MVNDNNAANGSNRFIRRSTPNITSIDTAPTTPHQPTISITPEGAGNSFPTDTEPPAAAAKGTTNTTNRTPRANHGRPSHPAATSEEDDVAFSFKARSKP